MSVMAFSLTEQLRTCTSKLLRAISPSLGRRHVPTLSTVKWTVATYVSTQEQTVAVYLIKVISFDVHIVRTIDEDRSTTVDCPVASTGDFIWFEERGCSVGDRQVRNCHALDWGLSVASHFHDCQQQQTQRRSVRIVWLLATRLFFRFCPSSSRCATAEMF
jgi:hypothetical protein